MKLATRLGGIIKLASLLVAMLLPLPRALAQDKGIDLPQATLAESQRIAVLIGNQDYRIGRLTYPLRDVEQLYAVLLKAGFRKENILLFRNLRTRSSFSEVEDKLRVLLAKNPGAVVFFYYSGHAVEIDGKNWLVPVDASPRKSITAVREMSYRLGDLLVAMNSGGGDAIDQPARLKLIFLDACRNNPFLDEVPSTKGGDSRPGIGNETLPSQEAPKTPGAYGMELYSRGYPGREVPDDGKFSEVLGRYVTRPGLELGMLWKRVADDLREETGIDPWSEGMVHEDFYFVPSFLAPDAPETRTVSRDLTYAESRVHKVKHAIVGSGMILTGLGSLAGGFYFKGQTDDASNAYYALPRGAPQSEFDQWYSRAAANRALNVVSWIAGPVLMLGGGLVIAF